MSTRIRSERFPCDDRQSKLLQKWILAKSEAPSRAFCDCNAVRRGTTLSWLKANVLRCLQRGPFNLPFQPLDERCTPELLDAASEVEASVKCERLQVELVHEGMQVDDAHLVVRLKRCAMKNISRIRRTFNPLALEPCSSQQTMSTQ